MAHPSEKIAANKDQRYQRPPLGRQKRDEQEEREARPEVMPSPRGGFRVLLQIIRPELRVSLDCFHVNLI